MLKMKSCIEIEVKGRKYEFHCEPDSPLQDAVEANIQINAFLLGRIEQRKQSEQVPEEKSE